MKYTVNEALGMSVIEISGKLDGLAMLFCKCGNGENFHDNEASAMVGVSEILRSMAHDLQQINNIIDRARYFDYNKVEIEFKNSSHHKLSILDQKIEEMVRAKHKKDTEQKRS